MAGVESFIPTIWEAALIENFYQYSRIGNVTFKPNITNGNKIIYNHVGSIEIKDFKCHEAIEYDPLQVTPTEFVLDQEKYFAFEVCDIEAVQAAGPLTGPHAREAAQTMAKYADKWALNKMATEATNTVALGTVDGSNAYAAISSVVMKLASMGVPLSESYVLIGYDVLANLNLDPLYTNFRDILDNGFVDGATINGTKIYVSPDLPANTILAGIKSAYAFGYQINKIQYIPVSEVTFAERVRGLYVYGGGLIRPEGLVKATYSA